MNIEELEVQRERGKAALDREEEECKGEEEEREEEEREESLRGKKCESGAVAQWRR